MPFRVTARTSLASLLIVGAAAAALVPPAQATDDGTGVRPAGLAQQIVRQIPGPALRRQASVPVPGPASGIGPGTYLVIDRPDGSFLCTAGFVFSGNGHLLLGTAGHCFLPATKTATHGPGADFNASTVKVSACLDSCFFGGQLGGLNPLIPLGPVRYARQSLNGVQVGHDFGLVEIPNGTNVRTTLPVWGGPTSVGPLGFGEPVCLFGNATGIAETFATAARAGVGLFSDNEVWGADIPSLNGDSGSAVETCAIDANGVAGRVAVGILTHLVAGGADTIEGTTIAQAQRLASEAGIGLSILGG